MPAAAVYSPPLSLVHATDSQHISMAGWDKRRVHCVSVTSHTVQCQCDLWCSTTRGRPQPSTIVPSLFAGVQPYIARRLSHEPCGSDSTGSLLSLGCIWSESIAVINQPDGAYSTLTHIFHPAVVGKKEISALFMMNLINSVRPAQSAHDPHVNKINDGECTKNCLLSTGLVRYCADWSTLGFTSPAA